MRPINKDKINWKMTYHYDLFDAWIDYGEVRFQATTPPEKDEPIVTLVFTWTNWDEGEISGPQELVDNLLIEAKIAALDKDQVNEQIDLS